MPAVAAWACAPSADRARGTPTEPTSPRRGCGKWRAPPGPAAEVADEDEYEGLPGQLAAAPVDGLASPSLARWSTEAKVEPRSRFSAPAALARA